MPYMDPMGIDGLKSRDYFIQSVVLKKHASLDLITLTFPKTNSSQLAAGLSKRKLIFQPQSFRCYVSFREGISKQFWHHQPQPFLGYVAGILSQGREKAVKALP